jgi:hypothetical protein
MEPNLKIKAHNHFTKSASPADPVPDLEPSRLITLISTQTLKVYDLSRYARYAGNPLIHQTSPQVGQASIINQPSSSALHKKPDINPKKCEFH